MKNIIILIIFIIINLSIAAQPNWQWANQIGGVGKNWGIVTADTLGYTYYFGDYNVKAYFLTDTVISNGDRDLVLAKFDKSGNEVWVKSFGANKTDLAGEIKISGLDSTIYLSGTFKSYLKIDTCQVLSFGGSQDMFLAKLDLDGHCIWLKNFGSYVDDWGYAFKQIVDGKIILHSNFEGIAQVGPYSNLGKGGYIIKFDTNGNCIWAKKKFENIYVNKIELLGDDFIFSGTSSQDTCVIDTMVMPPLMQYSWNDVLLFRMDSAGNLKWVKRSGGSDIDFGFGLGIDSSYNIYQSGDFEGTATFDGVTLSNNNKHDFFLTKYDSSGNLLWIRQCNSTGIYGGKGRGLVANSIGTTYTTGAFSGIATFGNFTLSSLNPQDMFIACYDSSGNCIWVRNFGHAVGLTITLNPAQEIICTGTFQNAVTIGTQNFTAYGQEDAYIAKLDSYNGTMQLPPPNNQLLIYANPTQGKCNITIPDDMANEAQLTLTVYDNIGRVIQERTVYLTDNKIKLNLSAEAKGMYHVALSSGTKRYTGKIIFE